MQLFKVEVRLANLASSQALHWNNHIQITDQIEHPTGGRQTSWLYTSVAGTRTRDLRVASPAR